MSLFSFHNEFDDITITLDDESIVVKGQITPDKYIVRVERGPDATEGEEADSEDEFTDRDSAVTFFMMKVQMEIDGTL